MAPTEAGQESATWPLPPFAVRLAGGTSCTCNVVDAVCSIEPLVPTIVSDKASGVVLVVVFIVNVEVPEPDIVAGLKPPLLIPLGKPDSLSAARLTDPLKPLSEVTDTVNVADPPGATATDDGVTAIEKSGVCGSTVIVRVGGLGSELPVLSITVR